VRLGRADRGPRRVRGLLAATMVRHGQTRASPLKYGQCSYRSGSRRRWPGSPRGSQGVDGSGAQWLIVLESGVSVDRGQQLRGRSPVLWPSARPSTGGRARRSHLRHLCPASLPDHPAPGASRARSPSRSDSVQTSHRPRPSLLVPFGSTVLPWLVNPVYRLAPPWSPGRRWATGREPCGRPKCAAVIRRERGPQ
jgi:hypothetical protein